MHEIEKWTTVSSHCTSAGWVEYQRSDRGAWRILENDARIGATSRPN